ncbi:MAG: GH92 family glycosyl hydrolase [Planctomycetales bacterium]
MFAWLQSFGVRSFVLFLVPTVLSAGPQVLPKSVQPGELGKHVNVMIGTGGKAHLCGMLSPAASVPFGMVRLGPDTMSLFGTKASSTSGYFYSDSKIIGFSHTRLSGTGATDGGNFLVFPTSDAAVGKHPRKLAVSYSHQDEVAFPGYYGVALPASGVTAEFTATQRVGVHRYTFADQQAPYLVLNVTSVLGKGTSKAGEVRILPDRQEIEGSVETFGTFSKRYGGIKVYFIAKFNRPFEKFGIWAGDKFAKDQSEGKHDDLNAGLGFASSQPNQVEVKLALSYVSIANARENLKAEAESKSFDEILTAAKSAWEEMLGRMRIEGGTDKQRTIYYTSLYHSCLMPTIFNDVNGDYFGFDKQVHRAEGFNYYTDMSLWDTFRTTHPLYNLMARGEQRDMLVSLVKMAEQGGYLPRWPSGNGYSTSLFGTPADMVVAESWLKGIRDFDAETAYQAMKKTALGPTVNSRFSGRAGIDLYLKYRYCPSDLMKKSVASTLEYCYSDSAVAKLAAALGHREDAAMFEEHSKYYRNLWNPETQYFHPRDAQGKFSPDFNPMLLTYLDFQGKYTHAYVEGSALQWRWAVPHDAEGLVALFKSREYFVQELEKFFEESPPGVSINPNAYYWHGNQPDIYAAFLFNAAGRPDLTQKWVRWILEQKYGDQENGVDGNDDGGTLSAWYVLASAGLYPTAGTDRYQLTSPLWKRTEIDLKGKRLTVIAEPADAAHPYIKQVWLNDKPIDRRWLQHSEIADGGTLRFEMSETPSNGK